MWFKSWFLVLWLFTAATHSPLFAETIQLSLKQAVEQAVAELGNVNIRLQKEQLNEAEARRKAARAALLPQLDGYANVQAQTVNLEAFGIQPNPILGMDPLVGPFTTVDIRGSVTQNILNLGAIRRYQSAATGLETAELIQHRTSDQTIASVATTYLQVLEAQARLESTESGIKLAESLLVLAENNRAAGTGTRLEVTRAEVQLKHEHQRHLAAMNRFQSIRFNLMKILGYPLDSELELTTKLDYVPLEVSSLTDALSRALQFRTDLAIESSREKAARLSYESVKYERVPSLIGFGNYGTIGVQPGSMRPTWVAGIQLRIPVFDGGAVDARRAERASQLRQAGIRSSDLQEQIELEVRLAFQALELTSQEVKVSEEGLLLAQEELNHARRRYESELTTNLEVTDAQNRLKRAEENRISALYQYNKARIDLLGAMGTIQEANLH